MSGKKDYSMATTNVVDEKVRELVETTYNTTTKIITTHIDVLHKLVQLLIEKEIVDGNLIGHGDLIPGSMIDRRVDHGRIGNY